MLNMLIVTAIVGVFFALVVAVRAFARAIDRQLPRQYELFPDRSARRLADQMWLQERYVRRLERQS